MLILLFFSAVKLQLLQNVCRDTPYKVRGFKKVYDEGVSLFIKVSSRHVNDLKTFDSDVPGNAKHMNLKVANSYLEYSKVATDLMSQRRMSFDSIKKALAKFIDELKEMAKHRVVANREDDALRCLKKIYELSRDAMQSTANIRTKYCDLNANKLPYWRQNGNTYEQMEEAIHLLMEDERKQDENVKERDKNFSRTITELTSQLRECLGRKESLLRRMFCFH